jgi:ribosomal protein S18 acetylase RimI-like enzyme
MSKILESVKKHRANRVMTEDYPMAHRGEWYSDADYEKTGGKIVHMHPKEYLAKVKPLTIDDASRDNIDDLKNHIRSGRKLDPLKIYSNGKEDGRHRAHAADELGITTVPVVKWNKINENEGGETPSKKFVDAMYTKHHVNPLNPHEFIMRHEKGYAFFDVSSAGGKSDEAHIHYFRTHPQRQGIGADALKELQGHAQEHGVKLHLHVGGNNSHIAPKRVLHKFYSKHGFKKTGHDEMMWHPSSKIDEAAVAKRAMKLMGG